jgi:hypothetical protein
MAQRLDVHWQESDGTVATITAMRHGEKRQITDETTLLDHGKIDLDRLASTLMNARAARSDP